MDDRDYETVEAVDENGRHITRIIHHEPPASDMTLIATAELDHLRARLEATEAALETLRAQLGDHGGGPRHFKCVPITAFAEKVSEKRTAFAQREEAVNECRRALAEVARLRAGEADDLPTPGTNYTPAQWIHRWNDATPEERLTRAEHILADTVTASRCIAADHDGAVAENEHLRCLHVRARAVAESWRAAGMRRADEDGDSMWVGLAHACAQILAALDGGTVEDADGNPIEGGTRG
ncbi:hypothetical protein [Nonomuraea sp. SYSU D8015]|uniref:hypothetical protein n=1 Tax=Nonomuraea sp. SYSU D8015 TaxID=2593644 RepID=UPI0016615311|nr:hypothetical protein [Nonomuraea sp. SYSU D8015]